MGRRVLVTGLGSFWGGLKMMHDAPLFGVGPQRFKDYSRRYSGLKIPYIAHNTYLELASEGGLPVVLLFLLTFSSAIVALGRAARIQGGGEACELAAWAETQPGAIGGGDRSARCAREAGIRRGAGADLERGIRCVPAR